METGRLDGFYGDCNISVENETVNFSEYKSMCSPEREWLGLHDPKTEMPVFLKRGQKQHNVEESNSSRLVTKIRWVVESVNGKLKCWKYLANIIPNTTLLI
jgi:hypothetical protein